MKKTDDLLNIFQSKEGHSHQRLFSLCVLLCMIM